jgi:exopolysaccharide biosynthesis protein
LFKRKYVWAIVYGVLLTAFTIYVALDTFVITRVYYTVPSEQNQQSASSEYVATEYQTAEQEDAATNQSTDDNSGNSSNSNGYADNSYTDENVQISITQYREYNTDIYVADVVLSSAEYLKTAFAQNAYGRNVTEKTSEIAATNNAILAINGDYYGTQESGYVLRNGVIYRNTAKQNQEDLVIQQDGSFQIINETDISAEQLLSNGAAQILSFGPALVKEQTVSVTENEEVGKAKASNPRTAIGVIDNLHYLFVVSDGRTSASEGLSLYQLANFMQSLNVKTAYNLDGGGSSTMYFNGTVINNPTTNGRHISERSVSDIVYIGY